MSEKLQKVLARAGLASRRKVEQWICQGRIRVNGQLAQLGQRVARKDHIFIDNKQLRQLDSANKPRLIMYHKPIGQICTRSDPKGRPTVYSHLPTLPQGRWISVGRLDFNTSGLILFTNDGDLAHRLMHPSSHLAREYAVRVFGQVTSDCLERLTQGVVLQAGRARFESLVDSGGKGLNHWYHVVVMEGRHRLVRRLWESQGLRVSRLKRVRFGPFCLGATLGQAQWLELDYPTTFCR